MLFPLLPIILLSIALLNIIIYQKTNHELTRVLTATTAIVTLIWGFAIAHWSIHLLCLVLLLRFRSGSMSMIFETVKLNK